MNGGVFDETYSRIRDQIDTLVETDPTAFYTAEEYMTAAQMLYDTVKLRAQSISGQLDGTIPSTDAGQRADSSSLVDASGIDIGAMGQFNMGGSFSGGFTGGSGRSGSGKGPDSVPSDGNGDDPEDTGKSGGDPGEADRSGETGSDPDSTEEDPFGIDIRDLIDGLFGGGDWSDLLPDGGQSGDIIEDPFDEGFSGDWSDMLPDGGEGYGRMSSNGSEGVIRFTDSGSSGQNPGGMPGGGSGGFPGGRPGGGSSGFDPGNAPGGGQGFDPGSMPEDGYDFDPGSMPQGGPDFDPGSFPGGSGSGEGRTPNEEGSSGQEDQPYGTEGREDASLDPGQSSGSRSQRPGSSGQTAQFSGFPGASLGSAVLKNLVIYVACMALILAAFFVIKSIRRTKYRK